MATTGDALTWLCHACVRFDVADRVLLTDPVLRDRVGPLRRHGPRPGVAVSDVTTVLLSHLHHDHLDVPSLRRLPRDAQVLVPRGGAGPVRAAGLREVVEVVPGDEVDVGGGVRVEVVPARHPGGRARTDLTSRAVGHLVLAPGATRGTYVAGDTGRQPEVEQALAGRVATAVLPAAGWGPSLGPEHLDPREAAEVAAVLGPELAVPYHWGTLLGPLARRLRPDLTDGAGGSFVAEVVRLAPAVRALVAPVGVAVPLPAPTGRWGDELRERRGRPLGGQ